jgi:outer membrane lipoprotein LolB
MGDEQRAMRAQCGFRLLPVAHSRLPIAGARWPQKLAAAAACLALAGCAALAPSDKPADRAAAFDLVGRVAATFDGRNFSSGLRWQHAVDRDQVWLMTPTGQALAHIEADDEGATLTGADRQTYRAADVEAITRRALGWELPLTRLAWWARGETVPGSKAEEAVRDQNGRLVRFAQDGWSITLTHPAERGSGMPQRVELVRGAHQIRLVIDSWRDDQSPLTP